MAWADDEIEEMLDNCDKIIFNSIGQLQRYTEASAGKVRGLRVNPQVSSSDVSSGVCLCLGGFLLLVGIDLLINKRSTLVAGLADVRQGFARPGAAGVLWRLPRPWRYSVPHRCRW